MYAKLKQRPLTIVIAIAVLLLILKYFWSFVQFPSVPFGYDAGIYRYLFIRHGDGWPPLFTATLPEWAKAHAPGLFFFSSPLVAVGIPADWLIGWVWNLFPIIVTCMLARVIAKQEGALTGVFVLFVSLLSIAQYEGFLMMYYKVFASFFWTVLAFGSFHRRSKWWVLFGMFAIATHQQIGLVAILATGAAVASEGVLQKNTQWLNRLAQWVLTCVLGAMWYLPTIQRSVGDVFPQFTASAGMIDVILIAVSLALLGVMFFVLPKLHRRALWILAGIAVGAILLALPMVIDAPDMLQKLFSTGKDLTPGAFLTIDAYFWQSLPLLILGIGGFVLSCRTEKGSVWQWAVVWCAVAVLGMLFFYQRFILPLDFFLLPFAARAAVALYHARTTLAHGVLAFLLLSQGVLMTERLLAIDPHIEPEWLQEFSALEAVVPDKSLVVVLDTMTPWVLGYLPYNDVTGPGIFESLPREEWEGFLLGDAAAQQKFLDQYPQGSYFYATDIFRAFYPPEVQVVLSHPCFQKTSIRGLLQSTCGYK